MENIAIETESQIQKPDYIWMLKMLISVPFIFGMIIPAIFLDICLFIYQNTALRLYGIPLVKRSEYIIFDRENAKFLNIVEKINCGYCSYVNGLFSYAVEIGGRTEKYWCPLKHAKKHKTTHRWQQHFGDEETSFRNQLCNNKTFKN